MSVRTVLGGFGINVILGVPAVGGMAAFYSPNIGGYQDPDYIDGYRYNPDDGKWYQTSPAPIYGQFAWENPANAQSQVELDAMRYINQQHNKMERLLPGDGDTNRSFPMEVINAITNLLHDPSTYRIVYYDPLVLDLNGNGIETVVANGMSGVLFDLNNDGIRTATGWISSNDGILVRDMNGNGNIDNGTEVFGDSTHVANGLTANNGFTALANLDSNGDGIVDAADAHFAQLQVWRDLNQNGISDTGELFTLQSLGIQSLNTAITSTPNAAVAGGIQAQTSSFTRTDGTTSTMADINLTQDTWHSRYIDQIAVPAALQHLPNISGMGRLRDLRQAGNDERWNIFA